MKQAKRSIISASNANRRLQCPGSYRLELEAPPEDQTEWAAEGDALHSAMESYTDGCDPPLWFNDAPMTSIVGEKHNGVEITKEHVHAKLDPALEALNLIADRADGFEWYETEISVVLPGPELRRGKVDLLAKGGDGRFYVIDYKFGDGVLVSARGNEQLLFYGLGAFYDLGAPIPSDWTLAIIQPREGEEPEDFLKTWDVTNHELTAFGQRLDEAQAKALSDEPPLKPGAHCRFCRGKVSCPALVGQVVELARVEPKGLSEIEIASALKLAENARMWVNAVFSYAEAEIHRGVQVPGYKRVQKRGTRKWIDSEAAEKVLKAEFTRDAVYEPKSIRSPAQIEKKVGKAAYREVVEALVHKVSSGFTIAVDTDSRPDESGTVRNLAEELKKKGLA